MSEWIVAHEEGIRLTVFFLVLAAMAVWETWAPRRRTAVGRATRWPANLGIVVVNTLAMRAVFPMAAVGIACFVEARGWGLFHHLAVPGWVATVASVILLDLAIYLQHVLFHAVPGLWRLHMVHHTDVEFDVTTGNRFHTIEILLSMAFKGGAIAALGAPALGVLIFEILLNAGSMFNHSNVNIPGPVDRVLRWFIVTPDMHRVHHSNLPGETNSNFGFSLPWWDRLLGTYRGQPSLGHEQMTIGLTPHRDAGKLKLGRLLVMPFVDRAGGYSSFRK